MSCGLKPLRLRNRKPRVIISDQASSLLNYAAGHVTLSPTITSQRLSSEEQRRRSSLESDRGFDPNNDYSKDPAREPHKWARDDQLSIILEVLDAETKRTPGNEFDEFSWEKRSKSKSPPPTRSHLKFQRGKGNTAVLQDVKEVPLEESPRKEKPKEDREKENVQLLTELKDKGKLIERGRDLERERRKTWEREIFKEYIVGAPPGHRPGLTKCKGQKLLVQTPGSSRDLKEAARKQQIQKMAENRGETSRTGRGGERADARSGSRGSFDTSAPETPQSQKSVPRAIEPPPRDLESIARIDASLVFEHFTTDDAWDLGCALRTRLLPIATPVVISISLANQNQVLFHTCTHSGVMPDNESWVARKRRTVLRWGVSTWYMSCRFAGDERAFAEKYGLGSGGGEYAIHGGGVPIRVRGVEGVVAVVVVSGLKQDEDHAVIVECIRELYY